MPCPTVEKFESHSPFRAHVFQNLINAGQKRPELCPPKGSVAYLVDDMAGWYKPLLLPIMHHGEAMKEIASHTFELLCLKHMLRKVSYSFNEGVGSEISLRDLC